MNKRNACILGFTLIEVLLALVIIAISLTALLRATGQDVRFTHRLKDKTVRHWVAKQAINQIQANIVTLRKSQPQTFQTNMLNQKWYWRASLSSSGIKGVAKVTISVSTKNSGPFLEALTAYKLVVS